MTKLKEHLDKASEVVQTWPAWKQEILGGKSSMTTLQRLEKELLILKNNFKVYKETIFAGDAAYHHQKNQIQLKQAAIARHKKQLEENKK